MWTGGKNIIAKAIQRETSSLEDGKLCKIFIAPITEKRYVVAAMFMVKPKTLNGLPCVIRYYDEVGTCVNKTLLPEDDQDGVIKEGLDELDELYICTSPNCYRSCWCGCSADHGFTNYKINDPKTITNVHDDPQEKTCSGGHMHAAPVTCCIS